MRLRAKITKFSDFLDKFNPSVQRDVCVSERKCFLGQYPTLYTLNKVYGENSGMLWLVPQLTNLCEYCGTKRKLGEEQYHDLASIIASNYGYLKVSELMLFFYRNKMGAYGDFFGNIDPVKIMKSFRVFLANRNEALTRYDDEKRFEKYQEDRKNAISWEEYCRRHGKDPSRKPKVELDTLNDAESTKEIARHTIEYDNEIMNEAFRKKYGCSPQEYLAKD